MRKKVGVLFNYIHHHIHYQLNGKEIPLEDSWQRTACVGSNRYVVCSVGKGEWGREWEKVFIVNNPMKELNSSEQCWDWGSSWNKPILSRVLMWFESENCQLSPGLYPVPIPTKTTTTLRNVLAALRRERKEGSKSHGERKEWLYGLST